MEKENQAIQKLAYQLQLSERSNENQLNALEIYIEHLLQTDFNKLLSIMYRLDVSEEKLKKAINSAFDLISTTKTITQLMIEREIERIKTKEKYSKNN